MKLKPDVSTYTEDGVQFLFRTEGGFRGLVRNNETAAFITDCLKTDTTPQQIVEALLSEYDVSPETAQRCVAETIQKFRSIGIIED